MKFYIKQKVFSFKDQFKVTDQNENLKYSVKGKFMSITNKLELLAVDGSQILNANKKVFSLLPKYFIYSPHGDLEAEIQKKFSIKPKFEITIGNEILSVEGSLFAHSFGVYRDGNIVASIEKKIISWGDTYEIEVLDEDKAELYLFLVIIIDQVLHEQQGKHGRSF